MQPCIGSVVPEQRCEESLVAAKAKETVTGDEGVDLGDGGGAFRMGVQLGGHLHSTRRSGLPERLLGQGKGRRRIEDAATQ